MIYNNVKQFIKKELNLIAENNFKELYDRASYWYCDEQHPDGMAPFLTDTLLECGINPLLYMKEIPQAYYCNNEIEEFIIPDNIEKINYGTLNLYKCKKFILPKNLKYLHLGVFDYIGCSNNLIVIYNGSIETLQRFIIDPNSTSNGNFNLRKLKFIIKGNEGILEYGPNPYINEWGFDLPF